MSTSEQADRRKRGSSSQFRLPPDVKEMLKRLAEANYSTMTAELIRAVRTRAVAEGVWPATGRPLVEVLGEDADE